MSAFHDNSLSVGRASENKKSSIEGYLERYLENSCTFALSVF